MERRLLSDAKTRYFPTVTSEATTCLDATLKESEATVNVTVTPGVAERRLKVFGGVTSQVP